MQTNHIRQHRGFTLVEVLVSVSLLAYLLTILFSVSDVASRAWRDGQSRTDAFQSGRTTLEIMARELTPAVVDARMQFVVAPGSVLSKAGATNVAESAPAMLWMAPVGEDGGLRCLGYYLYRDPARKFYRLKRLLIAPTDASGRLSDYFPRVASAQDPGNPTKLIDPRDKQNRTNPVDASWFTRNWDADAFDEEKEDNTKAVVSSAADGVIALWVQCYDQLGHPVPLVSQAKNHPKSELAYNSAAYFEMASTAPFSSGQSTLYLAETPLTPKANRVPQAVEITIVTLDRSTILKASAIPEQINAADASGALDVGASLRSYQELLKANHLYNARTFTTRAHLINGN